MLIFYYHRVGVFQRNEPRKLSVEPDVFETHLDILKKLRCVFIAPDDAVKMALNGKKPPRRSVLITFDDGYKDTVRFAFPLLKKNSIPSLMFITTAYVGKTDWNHKLHQIMDWDDIKNLYSSGVTIGSHTITHTPLTTLSLQDVQKEVYESKKILEARLKAEVKYFSYPQGAYNDDVVSVVRDAGYAAAFGTKKADKFHSGRMWTIRRIPVSANDKIKRFTMKTLKYINWL